MVRTLNVPMDNDNFSYIQDVKEKSGLAWEEFLLEAASTYEDHADELNKN
jgi:hypothetical protein